MSWRVIAIKNARTVQLKIDLYNFFASNSVKHVDTCQRMTHNTHTLTKTAGNRNERTNTGTMARTGV
jgi:hypothetical protein